MIAAGLVGVDRRGQAALLMAALVSNGGNVDCQWRSSCSAQALHASHGGALDDGVRHAPALVSAAVVLSTLLGAVTLTLLLAVLTVAPV